MEREFEAKLRLQQPLPGGVDGGKAVQRTNSIAFRAPQEQFTIKDFELGKVFGVGSYSQILLMQPENLLLTSDGHIKIADFGSVKPTRDSQMTVLPNSSSQLYVSENFISKSYKTALIVYLFVLLLDEKACTFVGTAAYVPPEVLNSCPATFA
ncbi:hypothetical protein GW17_00005502 [Ensete ventricosum]|nr:hypothetical protein GW17_00005502 [Ensete ventricosum]